MDWKLILGFPFLVILNLIIANEAKYMNVIHLLWHVPDLFQIFEVFVLPAQFKFKSVGFIEKIHWLEFYK